MLGELQTLPSKVEHSQIIARIESQAYGLCPSSGGRTCKTLTANVEELVGGAGVSTSAPFELRVEPASHQMPDQVPNRALSFRD